MDKQQLYSFFIQAMAAFLHGTELPPATLETADWGHLYQLAFRQSLSGALYDRVSKMEMPPPVAAKLRQDGYSTLVKSSMQQEAQQEMAAAMTAAGVRHLFFKGAVVRRYYANPTLRSMGDLDMLVDEQNRDAADEVMKRIGFGRLKDEGDVWVYQRQLCLVEIHTVLRLFDRAAQEQVPYTDVWDNTILVDGLTCRFTDEAEAEMVISHLTGHFCSSGCGLRQLMDVAAIATAFPTAAFWQAVLTRLARHGMDEFARHLLWLCKNWFAVPLAGGVTLPLEPDAQEGMQERLLGATTFGADERLMLAQMRRERRSQQAPTGTAGHFWQWLFPSAGSLKTRYAYAKKHPVLLPVAFFHRLIDGVTKNRRFHRQRLKYVSENLSGLDAESAFFDTIGL